MNRDDLLGEVLRDCAALRHPAGDPELAAVRVAILLEDVFGVTLPDAEIGPALLAGPAAVAAVLGRCRKAS